MIQDDLSTSLNQPKTELKKLYSKFVYWASSIVLAAVLLYYSLRGIEWDRVWRTLATTRLPYLGVCCGFVTVALFLRAVRWRILLSTQGEVAVSDAFWATSAGYFGNNFLPARAGELIRTMMISMRAGLGRMFVLTTALSERMMDAITLVLISACILLLLPSKNGWLAEAAKPFAVVGFGAVVAIAVLPRLQGFWERILRRIPIPESIRIKLIHILGQVLLGIRTFHDWNRMFRFAGLTIVIWFIDAINTVIVARSLGLSMTLPIAFLLIAGLGLGSALPSTPGYVGVYQFVAVSVLTPLGFTRNDAIAYVILLQALQYVVITFWGLLAFWRMRRLRLHTG